MAGGYNKSPGGIRVFVYCYVCGDGYHCIVLKIVCRYFFVAQPLQT